MRNHYEQLIQQGKLPNLKIIKIDDIILHEHVERERVRLLRTRIELSGSLQNPVVCCELPERRKYLLLDGAHRFTALRNLNCRYVPVQVIDYNDPLLILKKWRHLFLIPDERAVFDAVEKLDGVSCEIAEFKEEAPLHRDSSRFYAQIILKSGTSILITGKDDLKKKIAVINGLSSMYQPYGLVDRISYDDFGMLLTHYRDFTGLIFYPRFSKDDIIAIALNAEKLPAGITRHIIPKRALHLDLPLSMLRFSEQQNEVENFLMDFINQKIQNKAIRFYSESTFLFDD